MSDRSALRKAAVAGAVLGAGAVFAGGAVLSAATALARVLVTPSRRSADDVQILAVDAGSVTLRANDETRAPGQYGLWFSPGGGHARLGAVIDHDEHAGTVTRTLIGVDRGELRPGPGRWNQYFFAGTPRSALALAYRDVALPGPLGILPAWFVPPAEAPLTESSGTTWAILIHGRGASREECLRALPVLHRLGFPALVVSYRNDEGAARSTNGTYHLGDSEWEDVEAAIQYALDQGAHDVVLVGWSMGGAVALQTVSRSWAWTSVRALVLDAPVIDWRDVVEHHAAQNGVPDRIRRLSEMVLEHPALRRLAGVEQPISFDRLDWNRRAAELRVPVLLLHSEDDEFVPAGPSRRLAEARPDLITFVSSRGARHTKEWNVDPEAWDLAVARFLLAL